MSQTAKHRKRKKKPVTNKWDRFFLFQQKLFRKMGYKPTDAQREIYRAKARYIQILGGERAGKSMTTAMLAFIRSTFTVDGKPGIFWIVGPDYVQARKEFMYIKEFYEKVGHRLVKVSMPFGESSPWYMETSMGTKWFTKTSSDIRKLASEALDGAIMAEAAQQSYDVFLKLRGRVSERRGWLILSGTLETGGRWYAELYNRWQGKNVDGGKSFSLPTWSNTHIFPKGRKDPEIKALEESYPEALFLERFAAVPQKKQGLVFPEFSFDDHTSSKVSFDKDLPVSLAVDPGYTGAYAVLVIQERKEEYEDEEGEKRIKKFIDIVDEVYLRYSKVGDVIDECASRPWWENIPRGIQLGGVIDLAGTQHQGMDSHVEAWLDAGVSLAYNKVSIEQGIEIVRAALTGKNPYGVQLRISNKLPSDLDNEDHPKGILGEFGLYAYPRYLWNQKGVQQHRGTDKPVDRYNHALKALGYWLFHYYGPILNKEYSRKRLSYSHSYWRPI